MLWFRSIILSEKSAHINIHTVVGCDMGCLMNIQGMLSRMGSNIQVKHIAQVLAS
jgi:L-lactate dehydrogenase complex protein LldE